jgi:dTDP-4-dehydrorhamnose 3,5-epimerase
LHFAPTKFDKAWLIKPERHEDERGFFARTWCQREFEEHGLDADLVQCNVSFNKTKGTVRGMHFQTAPHEEVKLVRCTRGRVFDVIVDVRPRSTTFGESFGAELSAENGVAIYVPAGFAHGFQTLEDDCELFYQISCEHHAESARGIHYADSEVRIDWPLPASIVSDKDTRLPTVRELICEPYEPPRCPGVPKKMEAVR